MTIALLVVAAGGVAREGLAQSAADSLPVRNFYQEWFGSVARVPKAGGTGTPFETKYFDVLQRSVTGRWEVLYRMRSDSR